MSEPYSHPDQLYVHPLNKESVFFEIGGYKGEFSCRIADTYGCRVFVFEPFSEFYTELCQNTLGRANMHCVNAAVSSWNGRGEFKVKGSMTGFFADDGPGADVEVMTLKKAMEGLGVDHIDVLALNCEGAEFEILKQAQADGLMDKIGSIVVQWHPVFVGCEKAFEEAQNKLSETHILEVDGQWIWQIWRKKNEL